MGLVTRTLLGKGSQEWASEAVVSWSKADREREKGKERGREGKRETETERS